MTAGWLISLGVSSCFSVFKQCSREQEIIAASIFCPYQRRAVFVTSKVREEFALCTVKSLFLLSLSHLHLEVHRGLVCWGILSHSCLGHIACPLAGFLLVLSFCFIIWNEFWSPSLPSLVFHFTGFSFLGQNYIGYCPTPWLWIYVHITGRVLSLPWMRSPTGVREDPSLGISRNHQEKEESTLQGSLEWGNRDACWLSKWVHQMQLKWEDC